MISVSAGSLWFAVLIVFFWVFHGAEPGRRQIILTFMATSGFALLAVGCSMNGRAWIWMRISS